MVNVKRSVRRQRREEAITFILDALEWPDEVTTLDVWNKGHDMLEEGFHWPKQTKNSFKGFKGKESLANHLRVHPRLTKSHRVTSHKAGGRTTVYTVID
jgi:hypothetical protein